MHARVRRARARTHARTHNPGVRVGTRTRPRAHTHSLSRGRGRPTLTQAHAHASRTHKQTRMRTSARASLGAQRWYTHARACGYLQAGLRRSSAVYIHTHTHTHTQRYIYIYIYTYVYIYNIYIYICRRVYDAGRRARAPLHDPSTARRYATPRDNTPPANASHATLLPERRSTPRALGRERRVSPPRVPPRAIASGCAARAGVCGGGDGAREGRRVAEHDCARDVCGRCRASPPCNIRIVERPACRITA